MSWSWKRVSGPTARETAETSVLGTWCWNRRSASTDQTSYHVPHGAPTAQEHPVDVHHIVLPRGVCDPAHVAEIADAINRVVADFESQPSRRRKRRSICGARCAARPTGGHDSVAGPGATDVLFGCGPVHARPRTGGRCNAGAATRTARNRRYRDASHPVRRWRSNPGRSSCSPGSRGRRSDSAVPYATSRSGTAGRKFRLPHDAGRRLRVSFFGGRISGISVNGAPPPRERRAQGFFRRQSLNEPGSPAKTGFLETAFAAWFTGTHTRGIQEHASLGDEIGVENTAVMVEGFPALLFGQQVTITKPIPPDTTELRCIELPLSFR